VAFIEHLRKLNQILKFPLDKRPRESYKVAPRKFACGRKSYWENGVKKYKRYHAGCDLYAGLGDKIYAVADGTIKTYQDFYLQTWELEVDHGDFIVRYGEVQPPEKIPNTNSVPYSSQAPPSSVLKGLPDDLRVGDTVKRGQHIAYVGQLREKINGVRTDFTIDGKKVWMLHIEMYKGTATGSLTDKQNTTFDNVTSREYKRRKDLLDPTSYLDKMTID
jgi:murein DD-endopeptidase MepM/ murein hydrolase activator NlpD